MMAFNEDTRVKIPAILHLYCLGYEYLSLKTAVKDDRTNIFTDIFKESIERINPNLENIDTQRLLEDINLELDFEDLGQSFYRRLLDTSHIKLIDFNDFENNAFHVVTELSCTNGEDNFRPDITLLINGMPLAFIEVKKPNNQNGIIAEKERIDARFINKKFRKFINIAQILVFSNNMEYDSNDKIPIQGAFYATTASEKVIFHSFREEEDLNIEKKMRQATDNTQLTVLKDNNLVVIKSNKEFIENQNPNSPTNRLLSSLFLKERLAFLLKYGIVYVKKENSIIEKQIMRYPQIFATKSIEKTLESGAKKGIIWHTQGSGKTALAFYNVPYLTDYFQKKGIIAKFYFIVDRLDLMNQAIKEFRSRGLTAYTVDSKEALLSDFRSQKSIHNLTGNHEITVVNIQKFKEDNVVSEKDYALKTQRIYFLDEVHRSYNPQGSFLANLFGSDRNAILIGLTGTPLILNDRYSRDTFGNYIHKYYYNSSIADGYTLRLMREDIEGSYKIQLEDILETLLLKGSITKQKIYAHRKFVEPMLEYIVKDFSESRNRFGDKTIGAMVVCDSSEQAKMFEELFKVKYAAKYSAALILHDIGSKKERKDEIDDFKNGKIDFLFVYNMLLTGFDAPRLKKMYLCRLIKDHNLLQTLTRVNRRYNNFQFGFVVDFADIQKEFDLTNKAYFEELQANLGDEMLNYSNLFISKEEILEGVQLIKEKLFHYDTNNVENFRKQIDQIQDKKLILEIKKVLQNIPNLYNVSRNEAYFDLLAKIDFDTLRKLYREVENRLDLINLKEAFNSENQNINLLNEAIENVIFMFRKISEKELVIADQLKDALRKTREAFANNFDKKDPEFVTLYEELKRLFQEKNLGEITQEGMKQNMGALKDIYDKINEINRKNNLLKAKYQDDEKFARVHKRIVERKNITDKESMIHLILTNIKNKTDEVIFENENVLENENYFYQLMMQNTVPEFTKNSCNLQPDSAKFINSCITKEYINQFNGISAW